MVGNITVWLDIVLLKFRIFFQIVMGSIMNIQVED